MQSIFIAVQMFYKFFQTAFVMEDFFFFFLPSLSSEKSNFNSFIQKSHFTQRCRSVS